MKLKFNLVVCCLASAYFVMQAMAVFQGVELDKLSITKGIVLLSNIVASFILGVFLREPEKVKRQVRRIVVAKENKPRQMKPEEETEVSWN